MFYGKRGGEKESADRIGENRKMTKKLPLVKACARDIVDWGEREREAQQRVRPRDYKGDRTRGHSFGLCTEGQREARKLHS